MSENEFLPLIFTDEIALHNKNKTLENINDVEIMQMGTAPILINSIVTIEVPIGYAWNQVDPINWFLSVDQHTLRAITTQVRVATATTPALYMVSLIGGIIYNRVISGFEQLKGVTRFSTGSAGANNQFSITQGNPANIVFSQTGVEVINEVLGYVYSVDDLQEELINGFSIDIVEEYPSIILQDGTIVAFDPNNPEEFYSLFDGLHSYQYVNQVAIIVTSNLINNS